MSRNQRCRGDISATLAIIAEFPVNNEVHFSMERMREPFIMRFRMGAFFRFFLSSRVRRVTANTGIFTIPLLLSGRMK